LLQKALENFLEEFSFCAKDYDIFITDKSDVSSPKPILLIGESIKTPFTKEQLIEVMKSFNQPKVFSSLESEIESLVDNFKKELIEVVKKYAK